MMPDDAITIGREGEWKEIDWFVWLPTLGPTAFLIGRLIHASVFLSDNETFTLTGLGSYCGVKPSKARDAIARLGMFNIIHRVDPADRPGTFTIVGDWSTVPTRRNRKAAILNTSEGGSK